MSSRWVQHVKAYAKKHNVSYMCAVSDASKTYKKKVVKKKAVKPKAVVKKVVKKKEVVKKVVKKKETAKKAVKKRVAAVRNPIDIERELEQKRINALPGTFRSRIKKYSKLRDKIAKHRKEFNKKLQIEKKTGIAFRHFPYWRKLEELNKEYKLKVGAHPNSDTIQMIG
jgi:hypothetical protein